MLHCEVSQHSSKLPSFDVASLREIIQGYAFGLVIQKVGDLGSDGNVKTRWLESLGVRI
jgi:hypothetical protein